MPAIRAFSWHATRKVIPGVYPMTWINPTDTRGTADFLAGRFSLDLLPKPAEQRALYVDMPLGYRLDAHILNRTVKQFLTGTVNTTNTLNWYTAFYNGLKQRGVTDIAAIIMDEESNVTNWQFDNVKRNDAPTLAYLHQVFADPAVQMAMPDALRRFSVEMVLTQRNPDAVNAWNSWVIDIQNQMLRQLVLTPFVQVYGKVPLCTNWENMRGAFQTYDGHGWPVYLSQISDWSSPACYVGCFGNRYTMNPALTKDKYWNHFLDCLNYIRSATALNGRCAPWVSYRSWLNPDKQAPATVQWLWNQLMVHAVATGVDTFIFWNPKDLRAPDQDDNALGDFIQTVAQVEKVVRQLPEIRMDADEVITGDVTTRYADYIGNQNPNLNLQSSRYRDVPSRIPIRRLPSVSAPQGARLR